MKTREKRFCPPPTNLLEVLRALILLVCRCGLTRWIDVDTLKRMHKEGLEEQKAIHALGDEYAGARELFAERQEERYRRFRQVYEVLRARFREDRDVLIELDRLKRNRVRRPRRRPSVPGVKPPKAGPQAGTPPPPPA